MTTTTEDDTARPPLLQHEESAATPTQERVESDLLYTVEDVPPWYMSIFFGFQHYLTMAGGTVAIPIIVASYLCLQEDDPARGALVSTVLFHSGIVTLLQTTFGVRLPIIQGGDFAYVVPTIALLTTVYEPCDALPLANMTAAEREEAWQVRLRDVQGSIAVASLFQIILGFTGAIGFLLTWITPLAIVPTVSLVGLSLFDVAAAQASQHWGISLLTMGLMIIFSQYLRDVRLPLPWYSKGGGGVRVVWLPLFKCFPVLLAVFTSWSFCAVLTAFDTLPPTSPARTDTNGNLMANSPWFRVPYPGQWGMPTVSVAGVVGMLGGAMASIIESIGDYYACAKIAGAPRPPTSAINRGIGIEGIGCLLAGLFGTGNGTTSCSQNIGAIGVTKVGSRRVVQYSAVILILSGVFGKFGAVFVSIPEPVMAGVFIIMFAMITAVGMAPLQYIDLNSSRNLFILGYSIFFGLAVPKWLEVNPGIMRTGIPTLDQILTVVLQVPMLVGGFIGFFLDNTVPGTDKERGLIQWRANLKDPERLEAQGEIEGLSCYDFPVGMDFIKRNGWMRHVPFCPTFRGFTFPKSSPPPPLADLEAK
ncbi:solute carrier family 23 member 1-like [Penaeus japonicus]|uniref:solute carrier family 23 member 1-like n=1 Tax=Penaeus japonicus TaxID=27405 RepID=UPI001C710151|nr:solute carrier family 23 member 1-like [Penaeus japonicus]